MISQEQNQYQFYYLLYSPYKKHQKEMCFNQLLLWSKEFLDLLSFSLPWLLLSVSCSLFYFGRVTMYALNDTIVWTKERKTCSFYVIIKYLVLNIFIYEFIYLHIFTFIWFTQSLNKIALDSTPKHQGPYTHLQVHLKKLEYHNHQNCKK